MIELPDVERMIDGFAGYATGKTIASVIIDDADSVDIDEDLLAERIENEAIDSVQRHGTYIVVRFRSDANLVFHMGSEGEIYLDSQTTPPREDSKIRLQFAAGRELRFASSGRGVVNLVENGGFTEGTLDHLGIDPLSEDLTADVFIRLAAEHPRSSLKGLLMNEQAIAGIGNEYADEICFQAGLRPDLKVSEMSEKQLARVHRYLQRVLRRATLHWQAAHADPGWLINHRAKGEACPRCRNKLKAKSVSGKKTFMCVRCQRAA
jgi:formamidopyrimidine-DNA glycosylase